MRTALHKLGLGTVQWGTVYGVANRTGLTPADEVAQILAEARAAGVKTLDTAALYGVAEEVLGTHDLRDFRIVTKTPRLDARTGARQLADTLLQSLEKLHVDSVYALLVHNADDLLAPGGEALVEAMRALQRDGNVRKIGVSVYAGEQIRALLQIFTPDIVQAPVNVLDQRLLLDGSLALLRSCAVEIHARSIFLQGLLVLPLDSVPAYFEPIRPVLKRWHDACGEQRMTAVEAAMSFVRELAEVDCCIVGVDTLQQLQQCLRDFATERGFDARGLACNDPAYVNPSNWRKT